MINRSVNLSWIWSMAQTSGAWEKLNQVRFLSQDVRKYLVLIKKVTVQKGVLGIMVVSEKSSSGKKKKSPFPPSAFQKERKRLKQEFATFYIMWCYQLAIKEKGIFSFYCTSSFLLNARNFFPGILLTYEEQNTHNNEM